MNIWLQCLAYHKDEMNENNHDLNEFMYNVDIKKIVFVILAVNLNSIRFKIKKKIYTTK